MIFLFKSGTEVKTPIAINGYGASLEAFYARKHQARGHVLPRERGRSRLIAQP